MKHFHQATMFTRLVCGVLVLTVTMMYTPLVGVAETKAAEKGVRLHMMTYDTYKGETPDEVRVMVEDEVNSRLMKDKRIQWVSKGEVKKALKPAGGTPTEGIKGQPDWLDKAMSRLEQAREAYDNDEYSEAMDFAGKAIRGFQRCADLIRSWDVIEEAYIIQAASAVKVEENEESAVKELLTYNRRAKSAMYGGSAFQDMIKERAKALKKGRKRLTVTADPQDATIVINGREDDSRKLVKGTHWVQVTKEGYAPFAQLVELTKNTTVNVVLGKKGASDKDLWESYTKLQAKAKNLEFDEDFIHSATEIGEAIPADYIGFAVFESSKKKSRVTPYVLQVSDGQLVRLDEQTLRHNFVDADKSNARLAEDIRDAVVEEFPVECALIIGAPPVETFADEGGYEDVGRAEAYEVVDLSSGAVTFDRADQDKSEELGGVQCEDPNDPRCKENVIVKQTPIHEEWWFWTVIGVVLIGGVVGASVALQPEDNNKASSISLPAKQ